MPSSPHTRSISARVSMFSRWMVAMICLREGVISVVQLLTVAGTEMVVFSKGMLRMG